MALQIFVLRIKILLFIKMSYIETLCLNDIIIILSFEFKQALIKKLHCQRIGVSDKLLPYL